MAISVSVGYNGGFLPDVILLILLSYYHRGTRLNASSSMKRFCFCGYAHLINVLTISPPVWRILWCCVCFFGFIFVFLFSLKPRPFVQMFFVLRYACYRPDSHTTCFFLFSFFLFLWRCRLFRVFFVPVPFFSLYGEYVLRFALTDGIFLPCDHGLDFRHQLIT